MALAVKAKRSTSIASDVAAESSAVATGQGCSIGTNEEIINNTIEELPENAASLSEEQKQKQDKDADKVMRRQSVKNQRSLPAMLGLVRSKSDDKPLPPVPPLPSIEYPAQQQANVPNLGRRFLSAFRSNSGSDVSGTTTGSDAPLDNNQSGEGRPSTSGEPARGEMTSPTQSEQTAEPRRSHSSPMVQQLAPSSTTLNQSESSPEIQPRSTELELPVAVPIKSPIRGLTKEQKRQSGAAHKLAGLFKRKQSIPDLPAAAQAMKSPVESRKSPNVAVMSSSSHTLVRDRRLSSSASTPNLAELAAAGQDQQAMAVYAATERGDLPPMPAPPAAYPGVSTAAYGQPALGVSTDDERDDVGSPRMTPANTISHLSTIPEQQSDQQQQQQQKIRHLLRISTRNNSDSGPDTVAQRSDSISSDTHSMIPGRKSSISVGAGSQSVARGAVSLSAGVNASGTLAASLSSLARCTLFDVEEDQRQEMFDPSFGTYHADIGPPPPKSSPLSSFWFINTLHRSMVSTGAHLTPSMYIPRRLWYQSGIRVVAIETKLSVVTQLTQIFSSISPLLSLPDLDSLFDALAATTATVPTSNLDDERAQTVPWEADEVRARLNREKEGLHKSCVAMHHWLNNLEDALESNRRTLSKKLKFISSSASTASSVPIPHMTAENMHGSMTHLPAPTTGEGHAAVLLSPTVPSGGESNVSAMLNAPMSPSNEYPDMRMSDIRA
ncbi:hypothetical protein FBU59_002408, partial [Linderina macrospora]